MKNRARYSEYEGTSHYSIIRTTPLPDWMTDRSKLPRKPPVRPKRLPSFPPPAKEGA